MNHYKNYYKHLTEASPFDKSPDGPEGENWVRPGSDLDPGMETGKTNFPYGNGYPNYKPKVNDAEDFEEVARIDYIVDVPDEHSSQDTKKRWSTLYNVIKRKYSDFYHKYQNFIDELFANHDYLIPSWGIYESLLFAKQHPTHGNVPTSLKNIEVTEVDIEIAKKLEDFYYNELYRLIHHRDDPQNPLNYPLFVSLYDVTRSLGGYEEGGWWYDANKLVNSIEIRKVEELVPTAEKLYGKISNLDGKPRIYVEKTRNSQEKGAPEYR
jgi:hypothetical protein